MSTGIKTIGSMAFYNTGITSVVGIPLGIQSIGDEAFAMSSKMSIMYNSKLYAYTSFSSLNSVLKSKGVVTGSIV